MLFLVNEVRGTSKGRFYVEFTTKFSLKTTATRTVYEFHVDSKLFLLYFILISCYQIHTYILYIFHHRMQFLIYLY